MTKDRTSIASCDPYVLPEDLAYLRNTCAVQASMKSFRLGLPLVFPRLPE